MVAYKVQFVLHTADSNPENYVTNSWCVAAATDSDLDEFLIALKLFYSSIRANYSNLMAQNGHEVKAYNMDDPMPRAPVKEQTFNFGSAMLGAPAPTEVAICLSFQGPKISGVPQARRRGRVYIGPVPVGAIGTDGRPNTVDITRIRDAASVLLNTGGTPETWDWSVYSPTLGGSTIVTNGWVDNEFDTQRRRGRKATTRSVFS